MGEGDSIGLVDLPQELQLFILSFLPSRSPNRHIELFSLSIFLL